MGPKRYSAREEELLIRDFLRDRRGGFFVDVGAAHYRDNSNTFFLEEQRGWRGIAIDANPALAADYARHRPATKFFSVFVSDKTERARPFFVSDAFELSAGGESYLKGRVDPLTGKPLQYARITVPATTLNELLEREHVTKIDLLSMDIEQGEPAALAGFDIQRYRPDLVCIEMQGPTAAAIRDYMGKNAYVEITRYADLDGVNAYFAPREVARSR